jgi:dipeptidyl-peptidase-4
MSIVVACLLRLSPWRLAILLLCTLGVGVLVGPIPALRAFQPANPGKLTIDRVFATEEFHTADYGPVVWLSKRSAYTLKAPSEKVKGAHDIVRVDPASGGREVIVSAEHLIPRNESTPLAIEEFEWSKDDSLLLIYTNAKRVWRTNARGDYWVFEVSSRELHRLGGDAPASSLMYAHLSPDGRKAAYVRDRDLYVEDVATRAIRRLTRAESPHVLNGIADWVYEEELSVYDGFRWSPDSSTIAFWHLDTEGVDDYYLVDNIGGLYQQLTRFKYPKTGRKNSLCRIGVVAADPYAGSQPTARYFELPGDPANTYIARMEWAGNAQGVVLQQLNRLQNTNTVFLGDPATGALQKILVEQDKAWVDVHDHLHWFEDGKKLTWLSERDGWRRAYVVSRQGGEPKPITPPGIDVIDVAMVDANHGWLYYYASPANTTQRYLHRARLDGSGSQPVTPPDQPGTHQYEISPDGLWAIHTASSFDSPPTVEMLSLPEHKLVRTLVDNKKLREKLQALKRTPSEFFRIDIGDGVALDGWCIKPPDFDAGKRYPVLFHVYGEPMGRTVLDRWNPTMYLWHAMLAQDGYLVMSIDNRGTASPRGRDWRKVVYRQIGILAPREQAAAVRAIEKRWGFVDPKRVGVWGWSGGGSMTLNLMFRYPDVYQTGMAVAPVSNQRYYDTIYQERYMGLPQDNADGYREGSPITHAHGLKGNLLIVHGTADDNVHYANTEAVVDELIAANKPFTMMAYPNRTHAIREGRNTTRHLFALLTRYLHQNLPQGPR